MKFESGLVDPTLLGSGIQDGATNGAKAPSFDGA